MKDEGLGHDAGEPTLDISAEVEAACVGRGVQVGSVVTNDIFHAADLEQVDEHVDEKCTVGNG